MYQSFLLLINLWFPSFLLLYCQEINITGNSQLISWGKLSVNSHYKGTCMYYLKHCHQFVWNIQLDSESQVTNIAWKAEQYTIFHKKWSTLFHKKQSAIFVTRLSPRAVYFHTNQVAVLKCLFIVFYTLRCVNRGHWFLWNLIHLLNKQID